MTVDPIVMPESKEKPFLLRSKVVRNIGIGLFVFSFLAPPHWEGGDDFHLFGGVSAFITTPVTAFQLKHEDRLLFIVMMAAWIANFTIFTRLPPAAAVLAILLPWPAYIYLFSDLRAFVPFYPWAAGIALIHLSRFPQPRHNEPLHATAAVSGS
jgi:hypothetical protein